MNKNLFIYSFKYLAVLLALVTFSSCERTEFTEQDAFDLNEAKINAQDARDQAAMAAQDKRVMDMAMFRRSMDSLTRLNSGGKVFYTVNVVPGGSSAFSSGRFEEVEGLDGATVTVSQLGGAIVEQKTTVAGLASFEMYSGEVTVNVEAPNHTDLNYTANLTPDGGVPNGSLIYVGNVVPVFDDPNNPGAGSEENLATVKGFAFAELDITSGNNQEESVPDGTKVRAFINVNTQFLNTYIREANAEEGTNTGGQITRSGFIQRLAYEEAASTTGTTVTSPLNNDTAPDGGEYSITIGATASGLPITMQFDDFAADRTYYFQDSDGDFGGPNGTFGGPGSKRFIYTQNTQIPANTATGAIPVGAVGIQNPSVIGLVGSVNANGNLVSTVDFFSSALALDFDLVQTDATATATLTGGTSVLSVTITDGGFYYVAPTVTFGAAPAGGTTATGRAVLVPITAADITAAGGPLSATGLAAARGMRKIGSVTMNGADGVAGTADDTIGTGYTSNPTVTFTRFSYTGRDAANAIIPNGVGSVAAASSTIKYIRIINGGFGMTGATSTGVGNYTGTVPGVVFNNNVVPNGGGGILAAANLIIDNTVGTATEVQITTEGDGYTDAVAITFNYGVNATVTTTGGVLTPALFVGVGGELRWNTAVPSRILSATSGEVTFTGGTNYSFVPSVSSTGLVAAGTGTLPTFAATVVGGIVTQIELQGATSGWPNTEHTGNINISANPDGVAISAEGFTTGGSIDTYTFTGNYGVPPSIYKTSVENSGAPLSSGFAFNYLTADAAGNILANGVPAVLPAPPSLPAGSYSAASDFIFVFENPTTGTSNAWGYPIFDNGGNNVVGLLFAPGTGQGIGYTAVPAAGFKFWVLPNDLASTPNAALAKYAQLDANVAPPSGTVDANANGRSVRTAQALTITFTNGGLGYAIRPEFIISGGQRSAEDLATLNAGINAARVRLDFNSAGTIINNSIVYQFPGSAPFTDAGLATEPLMVNVSMDRLEGIFNEEVNWQTNFSPTFFGGISITTDGDTEINAPAEWVYDVNGDLADDEGALAMFNALENQEFLPADYNIRNLNAGVNGYDAVTGNPILVAPKTNFSYITAPTYTINMFGFDTGGAGVAILDPNTSDITGLRANDGANGTFPTGLNVSSFSIVANDAGSAGTLTAYNLGGGITGVRGSGERFRTLGGPSNFSVFSGLTYIRDVNYGTGIELE